MMNAFELVHEANGLGQRIEARQKRIKLTPRAKAVAEQDRADVERLRNLTGAVMDHAASQLAADYLESFAPDVADSIRTRLAEQTAPADLAQSSKDLAQKHSLPDQRMRDGTKRQQAHLRRAAVFRAEEEFARREADRATHGSAEKKAAQARLEWAGARAGRSITKAMKKAQGQGRATFKRGRRVRRTSSAYRAHRSQLRQQVKAQRGRSRRTFLALQTRKAALIVAHRMPGGRYEGFREVQRRRVKTRIKAFGRLVAASAGVARVALGGTARVIRGKTVDGERARGGLRSRVSEAYQDMRPTVRRWKQNRRAVVGNRMNNRVTRALKYGHLSREDYEERRGLFVSKRREAQAADVRARVDARAAEPARSAGTRGPAPARSPDPDSEANPWVEAGTAHRSNQSQEMYAGPHRPTPASHQYVGPEAPASPDPFAGATPTGTPSASQTSQRSPWEGLQNPPPGSASAHASATVPPMSTMARVQAYLSGELVPGGAPPRESAAQPSLTPGLPPMQQLTGQSGLRGTASAPSPAPPASGPQQGRSPGPELHPR